MMATYLQVNNMDEYDDLDTCDGDPVHTSYTYDRQGNVLTERSVHTPRGQAPIVREVTTAYNAAGRVARRRVTENGSEAEMSFTYDDCGRLASERMSNGVTRRYTYNIHGCPELTETVVPVELQADKDSVVTILPHLSPSYYRRLPPNVDSTKLEPINPPSVNPIVFTKTYTDRLLYTDGAHPRYGGSPSARINSLGGRYDYSYDPHDRLMRAYYTPGDKAAEGEDFTVTYSYDELSRPTDVDRSGVVSVDADGVETFGMLDELTYRYDESGALESIEGEHEGEDYYGRPGFSPRNGTYTWNKAGCMKSDSSRGISNITYNYRNLPSTVEFEDGSRLQHYYNADGSLLQTTYMTLRPDGGKLRPGINTRTKQYIGDRVFNKGKLEYSYFPGGYFDGTGGVHFLHSDYQGSVVMVTDSAGRVEQHNTYYPYGEPHRLPSGQRRLYCGKERESVTGEYDYGARLHFAPGLLWTVPDALADKTPNVSPYVFCNANPVRNIDLEGKLTIFVNGWHTSDGGSSAYWNGVDKKFTDYEKDYKEPIYLDGSIGGVFQTADHVMPVKNLLSNTHAYVRKGAGYTAGKIMAESIMSSLEEGESIRFVTHSMGAAYTKGFIKGMISALGTEVTDRIEYEVDIAPYQTDEQSAVPGVKTGTLQHTNDMVAKSGIMNDTDYRKAKKKETSWPAWLNSHKIDSFLDEIVDFLNGLKKADMKH